MTKVVLIGASEVAKSSVLWKDVSPDLIEFTKISQNLSFLTLTF